MKNALKFRKYIFSHYEKYQSVNTTVSIIALVHYMNFLTRLSLEGAVYCKFLTRSAVVFRGRRLSERGVYQRVAVIRVNIIGEKVSHDK